jgi:hypothetical protein
MSFGLRATYTGGSPYIPYDVNAMCVAVELADAIVISFSLKQIHF